MRSARGKLLSCALVAVIATLLFIPAESGAQGTVAPPQNFGDVGKGGTKGSENKNNQQKQGLPIGQSINANDDSVASTDLLTSTGEPETNANGMNSLNAATTNSSPVVYQDPESGLSSIMQKNKIREMSTNLLNSPLALMHVTWQLTEPAVAQGFANAFQQSAMMNQLTYSSMQALHEQYKLGGTQGFSQAVSDLNCQRTEILRQQKANEPTDWQKARMGCQAAHDTTLPTGSGTGAPAQEPQLDGSVASLSAEAAIPSVDCNAMEETRKSEIGKPLADQTVMSFIDVQLRSWPEQRRADVRASIGDVIYTYVGQDKNKPTRTSLLATCMKPPSKPAWKQAEELELAHWNAILKMFEDKCLAAAKEKNEEDQYTPFDPSKRNSFVETAEGHIDQFGFNRFKFTPNLIDIVYQLFISKEIKELSEAGCTARLSPDVDRNNLVKLKQRLVKTRVEHRTVHQLVLWITQGQTFERAMRLVAELNSTSLGADQGGDSGGGVIATFYYLIARSVRLNSLHELAEAARENLRQIEAFKKQMNDQAAMVSGKGGEALQSPFDSSNKAPSAGGYGN